jgi:environmental stress-induced protein Ves
MLLEGDGVRLFTHDARIDHPLDVPHQPFAFSGDEAIDCTMLGGASNDFNVMTRRGQWRADVRVLDSASCHRGSAARRAAGAAWRVAVEREACREGEGLHWADAPTGLAGHARWPAAKTRLMAVRIVPA